ncbi:hypothetical protein ASPWEDRAFT_123063 [Aspergillus wentii DTO 134E9]|uniref:Major facilitator superfamily (MFS) profile domain-containing protein n=1 Tax=Aspergillus wentii DTO 134E9 TaxID=1073089 RepID=A0A1L9RZJ4_ASPWE|nr:uncharacterized protein ASPWEDRAFT_123063 [Aspergillus wentii DTO 134E9]KAI9932721.1 hypothetical protein MW887_008970 [Aspergillus wentii]OJJ40294.1 hypothetical protein ASPWEDRAFT_123063 [Aspergillus wentii DTO 134E9]
MAIQDGDSDASRDILDPHHWLSTDTTPALSLNPNFKPDKDQLSEDHSLSETTEKCGDDRIDGNPEKSIAGHSNKPEKHENTPPDGGHQAWLTVAGGFCANLVSFGWINCIGVFQAYYETHQLKSYSTSTVTWITSLETFMMFFGGPLVGTLFDNFGPRWILLAGTLLHVFGLMMASISSEYYQFILAQGICSPLGTSVLYHVSINCASTWFHRRRALALGIIASGSSLGGVFLPIMVNRLIPRVGFGWTMRICAFLILFLLVISNLTMQSRLTHSPKPFNILGYIRPLKEVRFALITAGAFFFVWGIFLPYTFIITQAERYGMSHDLASYLISIMNATSIFGRIILAALADIFGRFNMMIFATALSAILVIALWLPSRSDGTAIAFSALYGLVSGAAVSLAPALVAQISDLREIGVRSGTFFAVASLGALTGPPIAGALIPDVLHSSYWKMQVFCAVVMFTGAAFFAFARGYVGGFGLTKKI